MALYDRQDEDRLVMILDSLGQIVSSSHVEPSFNLFAQNDIDDEDLKQGAEWMRNLFANRRIMDFPINFVAMGELLLQAEKSGWDWERAVDDQAYLVQVAPLVEASREEWASMSRSRQECAEKFSDSRMHLKFWQRPKSIRYIPVCMFTRSHKNQSGYLSLIEERLLDSSGFSKVPSYVNLSLKHCNGVDISVNAQTLFMEESRELGIDSVVNFFK